jgi:ADP-ribosylglycohydrolase
MPPSIRKALRSLDGLSVGDAFGELFFHLSPAVFMTRTLPAGPWSWTDDTHMAISVVENLSKYGRIEQDALAQAFAERFRRDPYRGYGGGARSLLIKLLEGMNWREVSPALFQGGSYGNGAAMRAAPIGGFFAGEPERAAEESQLAAVITHAHPEGQAGAMAIAAAAAIAAKAPLPTGREFIREVLAFVPPSLTRDQIDRSCHISRDNHAEAVRSLGTGIRVSSQDTVPFCLWSAAHHLTSFEEGLWWTARGLGDCDTTCAIVGGILALCAEVPQDWLVRREPLPVELRQCKG